VYYQNLIVSALRLRYGFNVLTISSAYKSAEDVEKYFKEHLEVGDYYNKDDKTEGKWLGKNCEEFGITAGSRVDSEKFGMLAQGLHPVTGKKITVRQKSHRSVCFDMVFSAPKSVSIMAITIGDRRLTDAHHRAVETAFPYLEAYAQTRVRQGLDRNTRERRITGNAIATRFTHFASRAKDPQLHTHNIVFNMTYDPVERRYKALDARAMFDATKFVSEVYRNALARDIRALGYEIEEGRHTWRIKGVSLDVESMYSKRANKIQERAAELEAATGVKADTRGRALLALTSRTKKDHDISDEDLRNFQLKQLKPELFRDLVRIKEQAEARVNRGGNGSTVDLQDTSYKKEVDKPVDREIEARASIQYALDHVFERNSVVKRDALLAAALKRAAGRTSMEELEKEIRSSRFIHRGDDVMTREERLREIKLLKIIREGKRVCPVLGKSAAMTASLAPTLSKEQHAAAMTLLNSRDRVILLRGAAGAGKTFTLNEIVKNASCSAIVTAPTSSAAETLRKEGFPEAITIQKLLENQAEREKAKGALLIIDEAGLLSTKQMEAAFELACTGDTRVLLVGDTRQHNSVEAGDALRLVEDYSVIKRTEIGTITRQKEIKYREAVQRLANGEIARGFEGLEQMDAIKEAKSGDRGRAVAKEYCEKAGSGTNVLVVTPTWSEHRLVTDAIRVELKARGILNKKGVELDVFKSLNFTRVEKRYSPNYGSGSYISFHRSRGEFKQGQIWEVEQYKDDKIMIRNTDGTQRTIAPGDYSRAYDVVQKDRAEFAPGDKVLLKANYTSSRHNRLPNGAIQEIEQISEDGRIHFKGGRILEKDFRHFTHGYAVTSQASQGKTADHVIVSCDSTSRMALSKNQLYVSCSRGRESVTVYTDNKERLRDAVERSSARKLVLERIVREGILRKKVMMLGVTIERSIEMARDLIDRTFEKYVRPGKVKARTVDRIRDKEHILGS